MNTQRVTSHPLQVPRPRCRRPSIPAELAESLAGAGDESAATTFASSFTDIDLPTWTNVE